METDKPEWQESTCATRFAVLQSGGRLGHGRGLQPLSTAVQIQLFCCVGTRSTSTRCGDRAFRGRRFLALEVGPGLNRVRASINRQRSCSRSRLYRNSTLENLARFLRSSKHPSFHLNSLLVGQLESWVPVRHNGFLVRDENEKRARQDGQPGSMLSPPRNQLRK